MKLKEAWAVSEEACGGIRQAGGINLWIQNQVQTHVGSLLSPRFDKLY